MDKNDAAESADFSSKDISATREEKEKSLARYKERLEKHEQTMLYKGQHRQG